MHLLEPASALTEVLLFAIILFRARLLLFAVQHTSAFGPSLCEMKNLRLLLLFLVGLLPACGPEKGTPGCSANPTILRVCGSPLLDHRIRVVVVDRFVVLGLDLVPDNAAVVVGHDGDVADKIFDENRVVVRALGDRFFVGAF